LQVSQIRFTLDRIFIGLSLTFASINPNDETTRPQAEASPASVELDAP
jgi:hypothetical protein